jgi:GTP-binding protein YchF
MKIALLGLPQAGKKTLFTLLTGREVQEGRKPGDVLEGVAPVQDARVDSLAEMFQPETKVYAENNYALCPDVVEGTGNAEWMDAVRKSDLICLVLRAFEGDEVYHPKGSVDPERDCDLLESELLLADMQVIEKRLQKIEKEKKSGLSTEQALEEATLMKCMEALESDKKICDLELAEHEQIAIKSLPLLTGIPVLCVYNVSEDDLSTADDKLKVSCSIEKEIMDIEDIAEREEFMGSLGIESSGLVRVNAAAYAALGLMSFYTVGKDECRAWTIIKGASAPEAAGKIHTDIQRGFIRVEVIKYDDLIEAGSEQKAKEQGKLQTNGKDYILQDGDICHYLFNV